MKYRTIISLLLFLLFFSPLRAAGEATGGFDAGNENGVIYALNCPESAHPVIAPASKKGPGAGLSLPLNLNFLFRTGLVFQSGVSPQQLKTGLLSESPAGECVREADLLCDFRGGHFAALPSGFHLLLKE